MKIQQIILEQTDKYVNNLVDEKCFAYLSI